MFRRVAAIVLALSLVSCAAFSTGRNFPSPTRDGIQVGKTVKSDLVKTFGEPTQVGLDSGDTTWTWLYFRKGSPDLTKQLTVVFTAEGTVKSYVFNSSFPEDMKAFR